MDFSLDYHSSRYKEKSLWHLQLRILDEDLISTGSALRLCQDVLF